MKRKTSIFCRSILSVAAAIALQAQAADARYMVYLNSFEVQKYEQEAIDAGYVQPQVPDGLTEQERDAYIARNMDVLTRSPGVERLTDELVREFSLGRVDKGGRHLPAFFVMLDDDKVAALLRSGRVVSVTKVGNGEGPDLEIGLVDEIGIAPPVNDALYMVYMNPFEVQKHEQAAIDAGYVRPQVPVVLKPEQVSEYITRNMDAFNYSPGIEKVKTELMQEFSLRNPAETAMQMPAFFTRLDTREVELLSKSDRVVSVTKIEDTDENALEFSAYYDYTTGGEVVPWGKQAVNADDGITASNRFYMIDTKWNAPALINEINLVSTNGYGANPPDHSASVASIAAAKANSAKIRGINPGQDVSHRGTDLSYADLINQIATISSVAEWDNQFSTLNLSIGQISPSTPPTFGHNQILGNVIRRASGRLLVVQSAGNKDDNACKYAFGYTSIGGTAKENDGVLVVGGTDRFGNRYPGFGRSNYGSCVEVWAPGHEMTTTLANGNLTSATGTSFAAPIVAALAGRYGTVNTRPIEREAYIRNNMMFTGKYEQGNSSNLPIYQARYVPPAYNSIPHKLPVAAVYSDTNQSNLHKLVDEKFYDGIDWNAGAHWGSIVLDLGSQKNVKGIRVMMRSSSNGGVLNFAAHGGNTIHITGPGKAVIPDNPIAWLNTTDQYDLVPYYIPLSGNWRYVMLQAHNVPSWLSYSEVEVYGF